MSVFSLYMFSRASKLILSSNFSVIFHSYSSRSFFQPQFLVIWRVIYLAQLLNHPSLSFLIILLSNSQLCSLVIFPVILLCNSSQQFFSILMPIILLSHCFQTFSQSFFIVILSIHFLDILTISQSVILLSNFSQ